MGFTQKESVKILYALCAIMGLVAVFCTETMFDDKRVIKSVAIAGIAVALFIINILIMRNPETRRHSGLTEDDMTTADYMHELTPEQAKKIELHNGGTVDPGNLQGEQEQHGKEQQSPEDEPRNAESGGTDGKD